MSKVILKLGADISTDDIYPGRYMATVLPTETPQFCFADRTEFNAKLKAKAFDRRVASSSPTPELRLRLVARAGRQRLKGHELTVVAKSIARIFLQNGINLGLRMVSARASRPRRATSWRSTADQVINRTTGKRFDVVKLPAARQAIIDAGGLIPFTRKRLMAQAR